MIDEWRAVGTKILSDKLGLSVLDERFDDILQEGVIAAWLATQIPRNDPKMYGKIAMKNRMVGFLRKPTKYTGAIVNKGKEYDMHSQKAREDFESAIWTEATDVFDALDLAPDVTKALDVLNDKDRIIAIGIALGHTFSELGQDLDEYSWTVERRWEEHIRPALRAELDSLTAAW